MCGQGEGTAGPTEGTEGLSSSTDGSTGPANAANVDVERFRASMNRLYNIYSEIALKADRVMENRCPYKDARSRCSAQFGCRNQFFTKDRWINRFALVATGLTTGQRGWMAARRQTLIPSRFPDTFRRVEGRQPVGEEST